MTGDDVARALADGAELARSRPPVRREHGRVVSACHECRREAVFSRGRWVHVADGSPLCVMGTADAMARVCGLLSRGRWTLAVLLAVLLVFVAGACSSGGDGDALLPTTTTTATVEADPVAAWCSDWTATMAAVDASTDPATLDTALPVAEAGVALDHPVISPAAADVVAQLTWGDETIADPSAPSGEALPPPPDPQAFTRALLTLDVECEAVP